MQDTSNLAYMAFVLNRHQILKERLFDPNFLTWENATAEHYVQGINRFEEKLPEDGGLKDLLLLHRLSEYLVHKDRVPWAAELIRPDLYQSRAWDVFFPGLDRKMFLDGCWTAIPVLLVMGNVASIRWFIAGLITADVKGKHWPKWVDSLIDNSAAKSLKDALAAAKTFLPGMAVLEQAKIYCFPLTVPNDLLQIRGESLGLPLALGFLKVLHGGVFPDWLAATGGIDADGNVYAVADIREKASLVILKKFNLFLLPGGNSSLSEKQSVESLPVSHLADANMFSDLYQPGNSAELMQLRQMKADARVFVDNCLSVRMECLKYISEPEPPAILKKEVQQSFQLFSALSTKFQESLGNDNLEAAAVLSAFAGPCDGEFIKSASPREWFTWCTRNLALCNHRGRVKEAAAWVEAADAVVDKARNSDEGLSYTADYYNHSFINMLHNQYRFQPVFDENFEKFRKYLEEQFRNDLVVNPDATKKRLGEYYGTLAQHFAFCGPACMEKTLEYSSLSRRAFGDGKVSEYINDWRRQHHYLAYAFLDAGRLDEAENSLKISLQISSIDDVDFRLGHFSKWDHALLARFIADDGFGIKNEDFFERIVSSAMKKTRKEHPWQLWYYNMGRILAAMGKISEAVDFFLKSLGLCLYDGLGPTVNVMALLPLSALREFGQLEDLHYRECELRVRSAAKELCQEHFSFLNEMNFERVLRHTVDKPLRLFPFNYR